MKGKPANNREQEITDSMNLLLLLKDINKLGLLIIETRIEVLERGYTTTSGYNWKGNMTDSMMLELLIEELKKIKVE